MAQIIALLGELITIVNNILTVVNFIANKLKTVAQENVPFHITTEVDIIGAVVTDATFGNEQINNNVLGLVTTLTADFDAIMAAIAALPQVGGVYPFSTSPSLTIDNTQTDAIATAVWTYRGPTTDDNAIDLLEDAGVMGINAGTWSDRVATYNPAPWQYLVNPFIDHGPVSASSLPVLDYTTVITSDATAVDWINRVIGPGTVQDGGGGVPVFLGDSSDNYWIPWLDAGVFAAIKAALFPSALAGGAPIWPGLSGVTLGTSVPIDVGVTVTGPMQGVLIALTSVPTDKSFFTFDSEVSYRNLGALSFSDDNGDLEISQPLGFTSALYLPKSMAEASTCVLRSVGGVVGTITPFTIP